ncbi:MAG: adenosylcobinamide-GDP ribazoletransferase, partial [Acidimicrobiales bacterium]
LTPFGDGKAAPTPGAMAWFPVVGACMGALLGAGWHRARQSMPAPVAGALMVMADHALTGALHLDGLADAADGLLAHAPKRARLEIMAEPQVGSFAIAAVSTAVMAKAAAFSALRPSVPMLASVYCSSRSLMALGARVLPYARESGLASAFLPKGSRRDVVAATGAAGAGVALAIASLAAGRRGAVSILAGWAAGAAVLLLAHRRIGGFTGDVLGAAGVACETCSLLAAGR